jgi:hypothetical protein
MLRVALLNVVAVAVAVAGQMVFSMWVVGTRSTRDKDSSAHVLPLQRLVEVAREEPLQLLLCGPAGVLVRHGTGKPHLALEMLREHQLGVLLLAQLVENGSDKATGVFRVCLHVCHDHVHVDVVVGPASPAVVVGGHADHLVGYLGLACQLCLGQCRHVDDGRAPRAVEIGLCACGELRALHADEQPRVVQPHAAHDLGQARVEGVAEADVADHAALEEGKGPDALCAVDGLVGHHEVARAHVLLQRADGGEGDDGADADAPQRGHVGAVPDLMRGELVVQAVAREEGHGHGLARRGRGMVQDGDGRRRLAPRRVDLERGGEGEAGQRLDARAADDGNVDGRCGRSGRVLRGGAEKAAHRRTWKRRQPLCGRRCRRVV